MGAMWAMGLTGNQAAYGPAGHRTVVAFTRVSAVSRRRWPHWVAAAAELVTVVRFWRNLDGEEPQVGWAARPT